MYEGKEMDELNPAGSDHQGNMPTEVKSIALKGLFVIACFYTLYFARALILPFTLAFLLNFLLRPVVRALKRIKIPEIAGAALVLMVVLGALGYGAIKLSEPAAEGMERVRGARREIQLKVAFCV